MKNLNFLSLLRVSVLLPGLLVSGGEAFAASEMGTTTINFRFAISTSPCEVKTPDPVSLGTLYTTDFTANAGYGGSDWTPFNLVVFNCPDQTEKVTVTFSGDPSPAGNAFYANKGDAGNLDVELRNGLDNQNLGVNQTLTQLIDKTSKGAVIKLKARAHEIQPGMGVTAGTIDSAVTATFTWY